ncbi:hypothetical protein OIDMADRAFT_17293 [Oidiodendron maius Zn]|uniref:Methyltransferase type 11 domain-containing protein n=1 Tax=Oidiodendron maius (strain Zn) TaxID=913774 RepID=A0A0C3D512_OIDMZ|nr:hypothetical protein OIDMADRAFT_17293 [Oidiodendron maius Zn]
MKENSALKIAPLIGLARGVVLDIGPGSGEWIGLFDKEKVIKIYGVEPNTDHHEGLRRKIKLEGLSDIYEIVPVGAEDLGSKWIQEGEADTIITVQCLCSVDNPKTMIGSLYGYLKPGGQWIVYEHVITHAGGLIALYQWAIDFVWPYFLGGCSITRDSGKWLREAGTWHKVDLRQPEGEPSYMVLPHVTGILTK